MKRLLLSAIALLAFGLGAQARNAADDLIRRVSEGTAKNVKTKIAPSADGNDYFSISGRGDKVLIEGNDAVSIATGLNWHLKYTAGIHLSWNNLTQPLPEKLPLPAGPIRKSTDLPYRYYLNFCTFSYSMAFWDWARWEKEIDWMAMHGINLVLDIIGNELVWYNLLERIGYTKEEINGFIAGPAFQAWWQMNNLEGWGGPNPDSYYEKQYALHKKILARMRALGIEPVFPGYSGMVPRDIADKLGFEVADPGRWNAFNRPAFLSPDDPNFDRIADMYYQEMEKLYGKADFYAMDPFHEGGRTEGVDLDKAGKAIMAAMKRANPDATWVIQAWQRNPRPAMIDNLAQGDLLILDLQSESRPQWGDKRSIWYRDNGYGKHDWIYCMLLNFGGNVGLHGKVDRLIDGYYLARTDPKGHGLKGVGVTPEGIENNPAMYELLYELPWRGERFDGGQWIRDYAAARYGKRDPRVEKAWELLYKTVYGYPDTGRGEGTVESVFCARPAFDIKRVSSWGDAVLFYDADLTRQAARLMLDAAPDFAGNDNFDYDLTDILRQAVADRGNELMRSFSEAFRNGDKEAFDRYAAEFMKDLRAQDLLLSRRPEFRLDTWIESARSLSDDEAEQDLYEWNARTLITIWGPRAASERGGLREYAHREWSGTLSGLYAGRWKRFFDAKSRELAGGEPEKMDFFPTDEAWTRSHDIPAPETVEGDIPEYVYNKVFGK